MNTVGLSPKMAAAKDYIAEYAREHGFPPTYQEIATHLGIRSRDNVNRIVKNLEKRGHLRRLKGHVRSSEIVNA